MALTYTQITETFADGTGQPLNNIGVSFAPSQTVYASGVPVVTPNTPITAEVVGGVLKSPSGGTLQLLDTSNTGLTVEGGTGFWYWTVTVTGQLTDQWSFFLPHSASPVDLYTLKNTPSQGGGGFTNPMTTLGDLIYENATPAAARLAGDTSNTRKFLREQSSGGVAQAPAWDTLQAGDIPQLADYAPTGLTGATSASRYVGATASGAPVSGTFALGDFVIDQSGKVWVCTTAGTPGTWTQAGSALDGTASDIQPSPGTQAAGSVGKGADAGHVHPQPPMFAPSGLTGATAASRYVGATVSGPPQSGTFAVGDWVQAQDGPIWLCITAGTPGKWKQAGDQPSDFRPETYGGLGDVRIVSDAAITSGQHQLTSATAAFTSSDAGKTIYVVGAGAAGADLFTTIATFTNSTTVQLTATAGSTVSGKGCVYHTNDAPAIKSTYAAAHAFALADPSHRARILLSKLYGVADAATIGGGTLGNAIIPLTIVAANSGGPKIRIEWAGDRTSDAAELAHWLQTVPQTTGPGLVCLRLDGTNDATFGPASIIGGPVNGYGASTSTFSNMSVVLSNFRFIMPFNSTYCGADFLGLAEDYETGVAAQPLAIVPSGGAWPQFNQASITNQYTFAIRKGDTNNNDRQDMSGCSCEGLCYGFMVSEHTTFDSLRVIYCINGLEIYAGSNMPHGIRGNHLSAEACANAVGVFGVLPFGNLVKATIAQVDIESSSLLFDSNNLMSGSIGVMANNTPGYGTYTITGGTPVKVYELMATTGPVSSPQAAPASGSPWVNSYAADAWITMSATTITAVTITGPTGTAVAQKGLAGSPASYALFLPSRSSYTPTYTGALAHTVTLVGRP